MIPVLPSRMIPVPCLVEPEKNPNSMERDAYRLLVEAIRRSGFLQPLLVREPKAGEMPPDQETVARLGGAEWYRIVDGVHRYHAAVELGLPEVSCIVLDNLDDATAAALQIGMNRLRGDLNLADVAKTVATLAGEFGWDTEQITLTGYTESEIVDLLKATRPSIDDVIADADLSMDTPPPAEREASGAFPLEIVFSSAADLKRAQKALKKAAGKGNGLATGMLRILDGEEAPS